MFASRIGSNATRPSSKLVAITTKNISRIIELHMLEDENAQAARIIAFSPDGSTLACSTLDMVSLWDVEKRRKRAQFHTPSLQMLYSPNGSVLTLAGRDIQFFDTNTDQLISTLKGHPGGTTAVAYSPDSTMLASGGMDGMVRIGSLKTHRLVQTFEHPAPVRGLAFSPDGEVVATTSWGDPTAPRNITLWSVKTGEKLAGLKSQTEKNVVYSPDGKILAVDGTLYNANTLQIIHDLRERVVVFSPDGTLVASCRSDYTTIGLWDVASGDKLLVLKGHTEAIWSLAFSPDGTMLASGSGSLDMRAILQKDENSSVSSDKSIRLWGIPEKDPDPTKPLQATTKQLKRLSR